MPRMMNTSFSNFTYGVVLRMVLRAAWNPTEDVAEAVRPEVADSRKVSHCE